MGDSSSLGGACHLNKLQQERVWDVVVIHSPLLASLNRNISERNICHRVALCVLLSSSIDPAVPCHAILLSVCHVPSSTINIFFRVTLSSAHPPPSPHRKPFCYINISLLVIERLADTQVVGRLAFVGSKVFRQHPKYSVTRHNNQLTGAQHKDKLRSWARDKYSKWCV